MDYDRKKTLILLGLLFIALTFVLLYFLSTTKKDDPISGQPTATPSTTSTATLTKTPIPTLQILKGDEDGNVIYYIDPKGNKVIEVKDYNITEEEAKTLLDLPADLEVVFLVPGAALPRDFGEEDLSPPEDFTEEIDFDEWGLDPEHSE